MRYTRCDNFQRITASLKNIVCVIQAWRSSDPALTITQRLWLIVGSRSNYPVSPILQREVPQLWLKTQAGLGLTCVISFNRNRPIQPAVPDRPPLIHRFVNSSGWKAAAETWLKLTFIKVYKSRKKPRGLCGIFCPLWTIFIIKKK